mmetsp:Transcript_30331/g.50397  ORF Transcript_30331/g.50397 Transcript_30331/m.50397 type:complete len:103 (-) Transcript_30331:66-374(-)|eukprot:CAMPEP_0178758900 /NCGR_PEP_ID=MMETSP0744-20121128/14638_1 /TAXON_ID=913974 /ORGANISM="Nitzschia punctata, Strain CCMP561" /LENGTH=102 /DNA_ID=CAMNT_0020413307 /DNA_START=217 /DNA_END=525 /DNA_ORIENTATION=-
MIRSIFVTLFCLIVLASHLEPTEGLAAIVRRFRNTGLWGKRAPVQQRSSAAAARVAFVQAAPSEDIRSVPPATAFDSFDADAYRREMTDLVYSRNMQRLHVN